MKIKIYSWNPEEPQEETFDNVEKFTYNAGWLFLEFIKGSNEYKSFAFGECAIEITKNDYFIIK